MRKLFTAIVLVVAVMAAAPASAKGPTGGTLTGPGITIPVEARGEGPQPGDSLIDEVGFFPAVFRETPDPMLEQAPTRALGPAFTLTWTVPSSATTSDRIRQTL